MNVIPLIVTDRGRGVYVTPGYYAFDLFRNYVKGDMLVRTDVSGPAFRNREYGMVPPGADNPVIEAVSLIRADFSRLDMVLLNKHYSEAVPADISVDAAPAFRESCTIYRIAADSTQDRNTFDEPHKLKGIVRVDAAAPGGTCSYSSGALHLSLPPHSITLISLET